MATKSVTMARVPGVGDNRSWVAYWTGATALANGDDGTAIELSGSADRSVQVFGTFGTGGNLKIEGSMDGSTWATLNDPASNALDIATAKIETVLELTRYIRPRVSAGDGSTSLSCFILFKR
jgi:hypothetical protein